MYFIFFAKPDPNLNHCIKIFAILFLAFEKFHSNNNVILILRRLSDWFRKLLKQYSKPGLILWLKHKKLLGFKIFLRTTTTT